MDGNFSLRRRKDRTRKLTAEAEGGVFAASKEEKQLWGTPEEVAPFDIGAEVKDEEVNRTQYDFVHSLNRSYQVPAS